MKVVVLNTVLSNTGDAAIFEAISRTLQSHSPSEHIEFTALDSAAKQARKLYPDWQISQQPTRSTHRSRFVRAGSSRARTIALRILTRLEWARRAALRFCPRSEFTDALRTIEQADIVLSSGGTYLVDHYDFRHRVAEIAFAHALGKNVFLWTQSLGPFTHRRATSAARKLLPVVSGVYFRDRRSEQAWTRLGSLPALSGVCADVVFSLYDPAAGRRVVGGDTPLVLFSVREWNQSVSGGDFSYDAYAQSMRKVAEKFIERGWRCRAVSTCQGVEGYTVDDSKTARHIFQGLDVEVDAAFHTPQELMNVLRSAQLVIATRMHMAIMSLITRTPVIAIAYETKSTELFNSIGAASSVVAIENVDDDWVTKVTSSEDLTSSAAILDAELLAALSADAGKPAEAVARASGLLR